MDRRDFLLLAGASALGGCRLWELPQRVSRPGLAEGHLLRDLLRGGAALPAPSGELATEVLILGSGVAGLSAGWKLAREGFDDFLLLAGPERYGNAAAGQNGALRYPTGAHYLPLPTQESTHVRELLAEFGVIEANPFGSHPEYSQAALLHAPHERVLYQDRWQEGLLPHDGVPAAELAEQERFFDQIEQLKQARGADGRRVFAIPLALSSRDPAWTALDSINFKQWLLQNGYRAPTLHTYLNYCCRDDYGARYEQVSAWAGLHYFAARRGQARNAADGTLLTWPDGLNPLARHLAARVGEQRLRNGFVLRLRETGHGVQALCGELGASGLRTFTIRARRAVCALPSHVAARVVANIGQYGFEPARDTPPHAAWLVSNFVMDGWPRELPGAPLAWDNVVHGGRGLGYVVSTHQDIRQARPTRTVFSAYQALTDRTPGGARRWLAQASPDELYREAACDLEAVYGWRLRRFASALNITLRGHAMAVPAPGFLSNQGLLNLRTADGKILFAHGDLSGLSLFEEAAWWGWQAALRIL